MRGPLLIVLLLAPLVTGCVAPWGDGPEETPWYPSRPTPATSDAGPPLVWSGRVVDARTGAPLPEARVRLDLVKLEPCQRQGLGWTSWEPPLDANATWGPFETARPRSDAFAFFLHATAPGHTGNVTFFGPAEAARGTTDLRVVLHETAAVEGTAPPGTVVALETDGWPRLTSADASGRFVLGGARVVPAQLVVATDPPRHVVVEAPAFVAAPEPERAGWRLEGVLRAESGAPVRADVVAWNGTQLWSAARSRDDGYFLLPLPPQGANLLLEARTEDGRWGGAKAFTLHGPPALRETILMRPRC